MKKFRLSKEALAQVPGSAGSRDRDYVAGFNPRKTRFTSSPGTSPKVGKPQLPNPGVASAPYKHQVVSGGKFKFF